MQIIFILLLGFVLRLINLNQSLWLDEAAQVLESQNSIAWLWQWMSADFHPPLYHFIIHFWLELGTAEWFLRLPSVAFGVLTIYFLYLLGKNLIDEKFGLLVAFLLSISPFHIYFSQELRMYSLSAFLSTVSMYFFLKAIKEEKLLWWIFFTLATILNLYTLYFAFFLLAVQLVFLIFNGSFKRVWQKFFLACLISLSSFIFWLPQFFVQLQGGNWLVKALPGWQEAVSVPAFKAPAQVLTKFFIGQINFQNTYFYGFIIACLFITFTFLFLKAWQSNNKNAFSLFFIWFLIPVFLATIISFFVPVISPKRLLLALPAFYGLLTLGINSIKSRKGQILATFMIVFISIASLGIYYLNPQFQRENWRGAVSYVEKNGNQQTLALFEFTDSFAPYLWYQTGRIKGAGALTEILANEKQIERALPSTTEKFNRIFLFQYLSELTDPNQLLSGWLVNHGWQLKETKDFLGVGFIYKYEKTL